LARLTPERRQIVLPKRNVYTTDGKAAAAYK
jgi:hypothetical protein